MQISKTIFQSIIDTLEENGPFNSTMELFELVSQTNYVQSREMDAVDAYEYAKENNCTFKTPDFDDAPTTDVELASEPISPMENGVRGPLEKPQNLENPVETVEKRDQEVVSNESLAVSSNVENVTKKVDSDLTRNSTTSKIVSRRPSSITNVPMEKKTGVNTGKNAGVPLWDGFLSIMIPSGKAPFKLNGIDKDSVSAWAVDTVKHFASNRQQILPTGLMYYVRQQFAVFSTEYEQVDAIIQELKSNLYLDRKVA